MSQNKIRDLIDGRTVYVVGGANEYVNWMQSAIVDKMEDAKFVVFTGGADVSPSLYKKKKHFTTYPSPKRDEEEVEEFNKARQLNKPLVGICRGAQFLCVQAGGILVQDQANLRLYHPMQVKDGKSIMVSSSHHQAQYPWVLPENKYRILGWTKGQSKYHLGETDKDEMIIGKVDGEIEVELCHFPEIDALAIQSHPEIVFNYIDTAAAAKESTAYFRDLLTQFLEGTL